MGTWYPAYVDVDDLVFWAQNQRSNLTTGDIPSTILKNADRTVFGLLEDENILVNYTGTVSGSAVTPNDINGYLESAAINFALELMAQNGMIHYTHGGIQGTQHGAVKHTFMRMQPMFFMGGLGNIDQLDAVMPFRSFKQAGQWFVRRFVNRYRLIGGGSRVSEPVIDYDRTSRGYGWNADESFMTGADASSSGLN